MFLVTKLGTDTNRSTVLLQGVPTVGFVAEEQASLDRHGPTNALSVWNGLMSKKALRKLT